MKVLVVDDMDVNRKLLRLTLRDHVIETTEAADGFEALAELKKEIPDAVISDILMPNMDGYRLCRAVRQDQSLQHLPFIFYTSTYTSDADEKLAMDCGADVYIRKPATAETLLKCLKELTGSVPGARTRHITETDDSLVMKEYNEVLIHKLEEKNAELSEARDALTRINDGLELRVKERTAELSAANEELEAFSHSLAHDLRSPLMVIDQFTERLIGQFAGKADEESMRHLHYIGHASKQMSALADDLLRLARASRAEMKREWVDLSALAAATFEDVRRLQPERRVDFTVAPNLVAKGDRALVRIALENLINNAWKYTSKTPAAEIEFGGRVEKDACVYFVRDNGAGFDMSRAGKLFSAFERLHRPDEFPGTGIGLTTVQRIINRHQGRVWARAAVGVGATFFFTLGPEDRL